MKDHSGAPSTAGATHLVQLLFRDVGFVLRAESAERALDLLAGLHVLRLAADHEGHVLLQGHVSIPASTDATSS